MTLVKMLTNLEAKRNTETSANAQWQREITGMDKCGINHKLADGGNHTIKPNNVLDAMIESSTKPRSRPAPNIDKARDVSR